MSTAQHDIVLRMLTDISQYTQQMNRSRGIASQTAQFIGAAFQSARRVAETAWGYTFGRMITGTFNMVSSAFSGFLSKGWELATGVETANVEFEVMIGNATTARNLVLDIKRYADQTAFHFPEALASAKTLLASGIAPGQVMPTLGRIGDISKAGQMYGNESGIGGTVELQRIATLYGKIYQMQRLTGREWLQFGRLGKPIISEMAAMMGKSTMELREMVMKGEIQFQDFAKTIQKMTDPGGKFAGMQQRLATETMAGRASILSDAWNNVKMAVVEALVKMFGLDSLLDRGANLAQKLANLIRDWTPALVEWATYFRNNAEPLFFGAIIACAQFGVAAVTAFEEFRTSIAGAAQEIRDLIKAINEMAPPMVKEVWGGIKAFYGGIQRHGQEIGDQWAYLLHPETRKPGETLTEYGLRSQAERERAAKTASLPPGMGGPNAGKKPPLSIAQTLISGFQATGKWAEQMLANPAYRAWSYAQPGNIGSGLPWEQYDPGQRQPPPPPKPKHQKHLERDFWTGGVGSIGGRERYAEAAKAIESLWKQDKQEELDRLDGIKAELEHTNELLGGGLF